MINKILCVDDDPITLMLCKKVIEKVSFAREIITAKNGEEAFIFFENKYLEIINGDNPEYPTIVLLDLNMPVMNGWEFLDAYLSNEFNKIFPDTKILILSSTIDPNDMEKSKTYPMVFEFLSKPITVEMMENLKSKI
jgi:CheY-like chemotaxis protein